MPILDIAVLCLQTLFLAFSQFHSSIVAFEHSAMDLWDA